MNIQRKRKSAPSPVAPLTVRFPPDDLAALRRLAKQNHRSLNAEVVHAIAAYIRQQDTDLDGWQHGGQEGQGE